MIQIYAYLENDQIAIDAFTNKIQAIKNVDIKIFASKICSNIDVGVESEKEYWKCIEKESIDANKYYYFINRYFDFEIELFEKIHKFNKNLILINPERYNKIGETNEEISILSSNDLELANYKYHLPYMFIKGNVLQKINLSVDFIYERDAYIYLETLKNIEDLQYINYSYLTYENRLEKTDSMSYFNRYNELDKVMKTINYTDEFTKEYIISLFKVYNFRTTRLENSILKQHLLNKTANIIRKYDVNIENKYAKYSYLSGKKKMLKTLINKRNIKKEIKNIVFIAIILKNKEKKYTMCCENLIGNNLTSGNDNGEILFNALPMESSYYAYNGKRYIKKHNYFKLGSLGFMKKLVSTKTICTTHVLFKDNFIPQMSSIKLQMWVNNKIDPKIIFLSHGVTRSDNSKYWKFAKIDYILAITKFERDLFLKYDYRFKPEQILEIGYPRHDVLKKINGNSVIIFPTWRAYLTEENFIESDYFIAWNNLAKDRKINNLLFENNLKIKYILHPQAARFEKIIREQWESDLFEVVRIENINITEEFSKAKFAITDYSSAVWDIAFLKTPVFFYTFEESGFHTSTYDITKIFDEKIGEMFSSTEDLEDIFEYYKNNNFTMKKKYDNYIDEQFFNTESDASTKIMSYL